MALLSELLEVSNAAAERQWPSADECWLHQQRSVLGALLRRLGVRPSGNWLGALHAKVSALVPAAYLKVYRDLPSEEELRTITALAQEQVDRASFKSADGKIASIDRAQLCERVLQPYRERGHVVSCAPMLHYRWFVMSPIEHLVGYAIPSDEALALIAAHAPLVEVGAGTGYWSAALRGWGVDVLAFDLRPPADNRSNPYFGEGLYTEVLQGSGASLFERPGAGAEGRAQGYSARTLLIVWPNNPDHADNAHLASGEGRVDGGQPTLPMWDAECLAAYLAAGGQKVVYVGEREATIRLAGGHTKPDCGVSSSRRFQKMLADNFELEAQLELPSWWMQADDLTVWRRRRVTPDPKASA